MKFKDLNMTIPTLQFSYLDMAITDEFDAPANSSSIFEENYKEKSPLSFINHLSAQSANIKYYTKLLTKG
jgi:hypothetical protein